MNTKTLFLIYLTSLQTAWCNVTVRVADPNSLLPLQTQEIVLGHPVALVISSDANEPWRGGLFIREQQRDLAKLQGRGDPNGRNYTESCLEAAGDFRRAFAWEDSSVEGFDFYTDDVLVSPGNWFVTRYLPLEPGDCTIEFYDYTRNDPNAWTEPAQTFSLTNTPSRDFNENGIVNFEDYSRLSRRWQDEDCGDPNWCGQTDLDRDGTVDLTDLVMFSEYWLWGMSGWKPAPPPTDPNVYYAIVDSNGLSEINLLVGESITLYMTKTTLEQDVYEFYLEATISDTNLGWIDNTEYDPNNPPGDGTARILVSPRITLFDYWGPGVSQTEGVQFYAANYNSLGDGRLTSFVYTASAAGDVILSLKDYGSIRSSLDSILIHQTELLGASSSTSSINTLIASSTRSTSKTLTTETTEDDSAYTIEETIKFLQILWKKEPELRESMTQEEWDAFIQSIKETA